MEKKHVLVTGGAGFIGSNIAAHHLGKGDAVWVIDNLQTGRLSNIQELLSNPSFQYTQADLRSCSKIQEAVQWADRIYHMAADVGQHYVLAHPIDTLSNNIKSYELLLEALVKSTSHARLILASTSGLYGHTTLNTQEGFKEDAVISFPSGKFIQETYPVGKFANEVMTLAYVNEKRVHATIVRIFNTIGMNQTSAYGMVVPAFIEQALSHRPLTVFGDGTQSRSFSNVRDTVSAMELLLENADAKGEVVNVGNDQEISIIDLAKMVIDRTKSPSKIQFIPYKDAYGIDFIDIRERRPCLKKLKKLTGFEPKWTLEKTIDELAASAKARSQVPVS